MRTVWKYPVSIVYQQHVAMPRGAWPLAFALQGGKPYVWALVDTEAEPTGRRLLITGTGHELAERVDSGNYVGTVVGHQGSLVWHLWDLGETAAPQQEWQA